jgi:isoleucyl-tRNA synthetase
MQQAPSIPDAEQRVLDLWRTIDAFKRSVAQRPADKSFIFYDGPPFATGLPHYGHLVASTLKDIVPRYWTMRGMRVERRFGWDTHGLPIEQQIQDRLKLSGPKAIRELGVDTFNETCRENVLTYVDEWRRTITRVGRWVDFDDDYKTMDLPFMESVWWAFGELWKKGLVYQGKRVMPYSWALATPLSNFEAGQDYRDVDDPALTIRLMLTEEDASLLIWTTTPWTLPSNLAVAVGPDIDYAKARVDGRAYYVARALVTQVLGDGAVVESEMKGSALVGKTYAPLFPFFAEEKARNAFQVIASGHVTTTDGTGLVHMAPAFGEDDFAACTKAGIRVIDPVDEEGKFTSLVPPYAGQLVKDADKQIAHDLKERGAVFKHASVRHAYPFCYRTGTPLIYKTTPSWYVSVEPLRDRMVAHNKTIHWVPEHVGEKRFENWLKDARDWSISRSRFWGTPIPLWECSACGAIECIASVRELEERTSATVTDLHAHKIDGLLVKCRRCSGPTKRIADVFDCWFESGSMPYAQVHYPFERKQQFESGFPAQFIAEGLDQTRGWFYTLLVLSTALFDKAPFQNCIVNGLVLAKTYQDEHGNRFPLAAVDDKGGKAFTKDGGKELKVLAEKMSKRLKNYPDPHVVIDQHGADALRAYLINSPVVRGEPLKFDELGVREVVRTVLLPLQNAWGFFVSYANIDAWHPSALASAPPLAQRAEIDRWILSVLQSLVRDVNTHMEGYYLDRVVPPMLGFIDDLTNWYIRRSRRRFWKSENDADKASAYATLYEVLTTFARVLAPVLPFVTESLYQNLVVEPGVAAAGHDSVHLTDYPLVDASRIDLALEGEMAAVRRVVVLGRALREKHKLKTRQPLAKATVVSHDDGVRAGIEHHQELVAEELNVKEVVVLKDDAGLGSVSFKANFKALGKRLGPKMKAAAAAIENFTRSQWSVLEDGGTIDIEGAAITKDDVTLTRSAAGDVVVESEGAITVALDTAVTEALRREGFARELVSRLQSKRKEQGLEITDRVQLDLISSDAFVAASFDDHRGMIARECLVTSSSFVSAGLEDEGEMDVDGHKLRVRVTKSPGLIGGPGA